MRRPPCPNAAWNIRQRPLRLLGFVGSAGCHCGAAQHWEAGVTFAFIPKGTGVLLVAVPRLQTLKGITRGASSEG
jgi:hypothetical protein